MLYTLLGCMYYLFLYRNNCQHVFIYYKLISKLANKYINKVIVTVITTIIRRLYSFNCISTKLD